MDSSSRLDLLRGLRSHPGWPVLQEEFLKRASQEAKAALALPLQAPVDLALLFQDRRARSEVWAAATRVLDELLPDKFERKTT